MTANGLVFGLAYVQFDSSKEYYYLRIIVKVGTAICSHCKLGWVGS
jgi:hypothetical protein